MMKKIYICVLLFLCMLQGFVTQAMTIEKPTSFSSLITQTAILSTEIERYRTSATLTKNKEILSQLSSAELTRVTGLSQESDVLKEEDLSKITWISKPLLGKYLNIIAKDVTYNSEIFEALLFAQKEERSGVSSIDVWFITTDFIDTINEKIVKKSEEIERIEREEREEFRTTMKATQDMLTRFIDCSTDEVNFVNSTIEIIKRNLGMFTPRYIYSTWAMGTCSGPFTPYPARSEKSLSEERETFTLALIQ